MKMLYGDLIDLEASPLQNSQINNIHSAIIYLLFTWCKKVLHRYMYMSNMVLNSGSLGWPMFYFNQSLNQSKLQPLSFFSENQLTPTLHDTHSEDATNNFALCMKIIKNYTCIKNSVV